MTGHCVIVLSTSRSPSRINRDYTIGKVLQSPQAQLQSGVISRNITKTKQSSGLDTSDNVTVHFLPV